MTQEPKPHYFHERPISERIALSFDVLGKQLFSGVLLANLGIADRVKHKEWDTIKPKRYEEYAREQWPEKADEIMRRSDISCVKEHDQIVTALEQCIQDIHGAQDSDAKGERVLKLQELSHSLEELFSKTKP